MIGTAQERLREIDGMYPVWETETILNRFEKASGEAFANDAAILG